MELYLIRHAQSENNARPTALRVEDPGLTSVGHKQAELLGQWVCGLSLTHVYTSAFLRTLLTSSYIYRSTGIAPQVRAELHEVGGCVAGNTPGQMTGRPGMNRPQVEQQFPGYEFPDDLPEEGWWRSQPYEPHENALLRARNLLQRTLDEFAGTNARIAYVMHADFKSLFIEQFHTGLLDTPWNTSVSHLRLNDNALLVERYNLVEHLSEDLLTS